MTPPDPPADRYWVHAGNATTGPFTAADLAADLTAGRLAWEALAAPVGGHDWRPLGELPGRDRPPAPPAGPATVAEPSVPAVAKCPWDPNVIALGSILFTPLWGGIMAAVNAGRVGRASDWLVGAVAVDLALVGRLWTVGLRPQRDVYADPVRNGAWCPMARWVVPHVAGSPLAVLTVVAYVLVPFIPAEPREVCDWFAHAGSAAEAKAYVTANLGPELDALPSAGDDGSVVVFADQRRSGPGERLRVSGRIPGRRGDRSGRCPADPDGRRVPPGRLRRRLEDRGHVHH